ncbi:type II toxin-antitoxin system RelE/ParE family toxin [Arthrobacter sp. UCD-GKA]|uniref:type II toxin-antitoxin system RelE/ParE family toxin n=1 Tax=Arthrobacter sp. UCD-GKA TaxID=1913576 RepID=UPI0009F2FB0A|nr:type II toxin-antitoxin system RelE/ParE family toxin [Arthrobacter sp. UCD-GKA]
MIETLKSETIDRWRSGLRDRRAAARVTAGIDRLAAGNPGDVKPVGPGISELRIDVGPGYRVYFLRDGDRLVLLLCGGNKSGQGSDSSDAYGIADEWKNDGQSKRSL